MPDELYNGDWEGYKEPEEPKFQPTSKEINRELIKKFFNYCRNTPEKAYWLRRRVVSSLGTFLLTTTALYRIPTILDEEGDLSELEVLLLDGGKPHPDEVEEFKHFHNENWVAAGCLFGIFSYAFQLVPYVYACDKGHYEVLAIPVLTNLVSFINKKRRETLAEIQNKSPNQFYKTSLQNLYPKTWELREQLKEAIKQEDYELADELKNKINRIKGEEL